MKKSQARLSSAERQHQSCTRLVVELRGDVEALGLGQLVAGHLARAAVGLNDGSGCKSKIRFTYFFPCRLHAALLDLTAVNHF